MVLLSYNPWNWDEDPEEYDPVDKWMKRIAVIACVTSASIMFGIGYLIYKLLA